MTVVRSPPQLFLRGFMREWTYGRELLGVWGWAFHCW